MSFTSFQVLTAADLNAACFPDICVVSNSVAVSIATGTPTTIGADTELLDASGLHSTTTNTNRITVAKAGVYRVCAHVKFTLNSTGLRAVDFRKNGTAWVNTVVTAVNGGDTDVAAISYIQLAAGDYVDMTVFQNSGGALNTQMRSFSVELIPT